MRFLLAVIFSNLFLSGFSQSNERYVDNEKAVAGLGVGLSLTGLLMDQDLQGDTIDFISNSKIAVQGTYDLFAGKRFTFGAQMCYQKFNVYVNHWEYANTSGRWQRKEDINVKLNRFYLGARFLYHFKNTSKLDIYSGMRFGMTFWSKKFSQTDAEFTKAFEKEFPFITSQSIGIVALGARVKFTPQVSALLEFNLGSPYLFAFGLGYTLPK